MPGMGPASEIRDSHPRWPSLPERYRRIRLLSRGSSSLVYEAEDAVLARRVAIKWAFRPTAFERSLPSLLCDGRFVDPLQHPNIVALHTTGTADGGVYLVMELVEGGPVQDLVEHGPLSWFEATCVLVAASEAVAAVHEYGLLHRDIKPSNLLLSTTGAVKLVDFGLACWLHPSKRAIDTTTAGTPHYMSPEQCRGDEVDERTDIYSLGATYFSLLTGRTPFAHPAPLQVMLAHCSAPTPDPCNQQQQIPRSCAEVVMRAMAKQRPDRYGSVREMLIALRAVLMRRSWRGGTEATR